MVSDYAHQVVDELNTFRNLPDDARVLAKELTTLGFKMVDLDDNDDLWYEAAISLKVQEACNALGIWASPHQALNIAKNMRVGKKYRNGIPLTDKERAIAVQLRLVWIKQVCKEEGVPFSEAHEKDAHRIVRFGERGLTTAHKIGEASGCFGSFLVLTTGSLLILCAAIELF